MKRFKFEVVIIGETDITPNMEDKLFEQGCNDALLFLFNGQVKMEFDRIANTKSIAINSAINDIARAGYRAKLSH